MKIQQILDEKGAHVVNVSPGATAMDALQLLVAHKIGSVVVLDGTEIVGILTERHLLRLASRGPELLRTHCVSDIMTENPLVGIPSNDVDYVMDIMTQNRVRHLPVVDAGMLVGIISIGDVVNAVRQDTEAENHHLRRYLQGQVR
ncbi:MAG: CBS domain-containing protein [Gemmatimonadales bacterium]|nr:MAG: CBS domain-containing protein [Gemmatimonadales bacterium]